MDFKKSILYFAVAILGVMLWHVWQRDYSPQLQNATTPTTTLTTQSPVDFAPNSSLSQPMAAAPTIKNIAQALPEHKMITIKTNMLTARINLRGGNLVDVQLSQYPVSFTEKNKPMQILNANTDTLYVAQSGLSDAAQTHAAPIEYQTAQTQYVLPTDQKTMAIVLTGKNPQGILVQKTFTFTRDSYAIQTAITVTNASQQIWRGNIYNQITRRYTTHNSSFYSRSYDGAAVSTPNTPYKKLTFESMSENNFSRSMQNGWIAMQQPYFLSAWIPPKNETIQYYSRSFGNGDDGKNNIFVLGYLSGAIQLKPNASTLFSSTLYVGPEIAKNLDALAKGLGLTVDYGWLWPISKILFWLMNEIHHYIGNWGWSIILVTILIKIVFYGLSNKSYRSMARTRDLQPKIKALRDRYGDDKQAMSKSMMELYRKEKINPLGGCLPMVIQIPVFIALYYVLIESVELRQAHFIFWIHDLSIKDPYYILPVLMGLSMLLQQKLSPPPPDPTQAKMMMMLPIVFTVFFATFPAGLVLYWITNNCASILQQWIVMRTAKKHARKTT